MDMDYSVRGPRDVVVSGPLGPLNKEKKGRWFNTPYEALEWARTKYGEDRVRLIYPNTELDEMEYVRWAVLVKNLAS